MSATEEKSITENNAVLDADANFIMDELRLGVWKVIIAKRKMAHNFFTEIRDTYPLFRRLILEIYTVSPRFFLVFLLCQMWNGVEDAIQMHFSSNLLYAIETGISSGRPNKTQIALAVGARICCSAIVSYVDWINEFVFPILEGRVNRYLRMDLMKSKLSVDMPTSQEATREQEVSAEEAWDCVKQILFFFTEIFKIASQLFLILELSRRTGGPIFAFLCILKPVVSTFFYQALWRKVFFAYVDNDDYKRMKSLEAFADGSFRQDVITNNLGSWIAREYQRAYSALGNINLSEPFVTYGKRDTPVVQLSTKVLGELPLLYCSLQAIYYPHRFSVAAIATLQNSADTLRSSLEFFLVRTQEFRSGLATLRRMGGSKSNLLKDGAVEYPRIIEKGEMNGTKGMSFALQDVSFTYPGSEKKSNALNHISLNIEAGQLVVIVGANGSGKSTLVRILSRLYDPSSGHVVIDGLPSGDYRVADLHRATAILSQDSLIYPLSLAENIGLGHPDSFSNIELIEEAAKEGGASEFIGKLEKGLNTTLDPFHDAFHMNLNGDRKHPLWIMSNKLAKRADISGGERQRVVAARTFMRFKTGKVKFVAVDEPSSALDADGEQQLFEKLLAAKEGKTMVFVTHRFGHLTKFADQIICMKEGSIVETGTHEELMKAKGEYSTLYDIQAKAFSNATPVAASTVINATPGNI